MPVKRRTAGKRRRELSQGESNWLNSGVGDVDQKYLWSHDDLAALWREFVDEIVAEHVVASPGTRPLRWWQFSAPEPRRRVGGVGTPCHERLAYVLQHHLGVPWDWIFHDDIDMYMRIGSPLGVPALDPANPPTYESEAAYLERLELFLPDEREQLKPKDFKPEYVVDILGIEFDEDDDVDNIAVQIAAGQSLSAECDIGNKSLVGIIVPANWTTASLSFQVSIDGGITWVELLVGATGLPFAISSLTGGTLSYSVAIDPTTLRGVQALKIRSGTQASPVNQTNTVTLKFVSRLAF
jgi:hypothetical protein